ncbi:multidrug effflux MFS transporter [Roseomonas sp. AR75]|uniref:multidrug effflux MFS transporter n=1 Tax=Roseomonas sp. AR75 TaxID=2562311 RepID=UPI0010C0D22A|nr:multidrug effflux MFS transporter [Roseomonas sp. AR75]
MQQDRPGQPGAPPDPRPPLWLLALITLSGTMAMHVFVPALPEAGAALGATPAAMQLTVSFYVLGLALGQLVYGPVSDRFGRRPVLMAGLALFTAAGLWATAAPGVQSLTAARLVQALGGCAGLVIARAMLRDGTTTALAAQRLALMNLMVILGPGLAPLIGAALAALTGWRSIFVALSLLGLLNLLLAWRLLPETHRGTGQSVAAVLRSYRRLAASPRFLGFAIGGGCATTAMYAYIAAAPFILGVELGRPPGEVGLYLALNIFGAWLGSLAASRLVQRVPVRRLLFGGTLIGGAGAAVFLGAALAGALSVPLVVAPMMLFTFGAGMASPAALGEALSVNPRAAGSASGLYGFAQMAIGALCAALAGIGSNPAIAAGTVLFAASAIALAAFAVAMRVRAVTPP